MKQLEYKQYHFQSPLHCWLDMTDSEDFQGWRNIILFMPWDEKLVSFEGKFRPGKSEKRWDKYMIPGELERFISEVNGGKSRGVIRFGNKKEKGNFCLVGGTLEGSTFTIFYRALEISLEWPFDMVLLNQIIKKSGIKVKKLVVIANRAFTSTRAGRRSYYHKLRKVLGVDDENGKRL